MRVGNSEEVLALNLLRKERIFPILNKLDRIWAKNSDKQLIELLIEIIPKDVINDLELTQFLDEYIEKNNIK